MDHGPSRAQMARHRCRSSTRSMTGMNKRISLKVPRKSLKAITLDTGEPVDAETGLHQSQFRNDLVRHVREDPNASRHARVDEGTSRGLPVSAWIKQHSSWDAVTPENVSVDPREDEGRGPETPLHESCWTAVVPLGGRRGSAGRRRAEEPMTNEATKLPSDDDSLEA